MTVPNTTISVTHSLLIEQAARWLRKTGCAVVITDMTHGGPELVLETGVRQTEAMALYRRHGFTGTPCWGDYATSPLSLCLAKTLP